MKKQCFSGFPLAGMARTSTLVLCLLTLPLAASAASSSLSELLEKGIYSEETKGDLDGAIQVYKQVATEAKAGQSLGAEAQYRLGVCQYKKKNFGEASAAFEKLLRDFPGQKEYAAKAREYLAGTLVLRPAPWTDGEELQLDLRFSTGFKLGTAHLWVNAAEADGTRVWRFRSHLYAGVHQLSRVEVEADTLKPLRSWWKHGLLGEAEAVYDKGQVRITLIGKDKTINLELEGRVFDNEEVMQAIRRLPLTTNYSQNLRIQTSLGGGNIIPVGLTVAGIEPVTVPAGTFECYKLELSLRQTFWYSTDAHHYLVKFEAGGVAAELVSVVPGPPGAPEIYKDAEMSLAAPNGWMFFHPEGKEGNIKSSVLAFDPDGLATGAVRFRALDALPPESQKSTRAWAELILADEAKSKKDLQVRQNGWQERTVAGQPGTAFMADFKDGLEAKVLYYQAAFLKTKALEYYVEAPALEFEALRVKYEGIFDSCKITEP